MNLQKTTSVPIPHTENCDCSDQELCAYIEALLIDDALRSYSTFAVEENFAIETSPTYSRCYDQPRSESEMNF